MATITEADNYFNERLWTDEWDNSNDSRKKAALTQAKNQLLDLDFEAKISSENHSRAVLEQALFLLKLTSEDRERLRLQAQGVESIRISDGISEGYNGEDNFISPRVKQMIKANNFQTGEMI